ncbi:MAG TPA: bifunctional 2-C-methyl-D-erythritol 4-phosphate cytidylyltransferase/2-C-methyl-D-erythritol 2,4-cyclodiphosphate synthase [Caulobacteraceae bacterium]|nr:bifunctional 2-C-methyl-D-erythritol 4-phosphate cytidylyltransferase/2-C-methyl-D-erythritol 2,4-cyclodiphosphate synthase [Caulobacteraceae bacterium]
MEWSAVIVAAGASSRAGAGPRKPWRRLGGRAVARWSLDALSAAGAGRVVLVVAPEDEALAAEVAGSPETCAVVIGGATRAQSVRAGLAALSDAPAASAVLVHDAARPFVAERHVRALLDALEHADGAVPALPVSDTLKRANATGETSTAAREGLNRAQTPQAFRLGALRDAYAAWEPGDGEPTDDAQVVERAGGSVVLAPGDPMLMKLTYPEDFTMAEALARSASVTRVGHGFDAHRFGPGDHVTLCGVRIPHGQALIGHSDADAGLHALTDALLGAIGDGDIGEHFPASDSRWRDADSAVFLADAMARVQARGGAVVNVDVTLICEQPRLSPYRQAMRERLSALLDLPLDAVSVKATTTEQMGFTGRREGLAAQALAVVQLPA